MRDHCARTTTLVMPGLDLSLHPKPAKPDPGGHPCPSPQRATSVLPPVPPWREIRGEMARQGITYAQLVERLDAIGVKEDERNLRNKVSRGKFTAAFLLACLSALGAGRVEVRD